MIELYVVLAVFAALFTATSTTIEKYVVERYIELDEPLVAVAGLTSAIVAVCVWVFRPIPTVYSPRVLGILVAIGILAYAPLYVFFRALRRDDVSAIGPMIPAGQVITLTLAYVFLEEVLDPVTYVGIALIIGGVMIVSIVGSEDDQLIPRLSPAFGLLMLALFGWSVQGILTKMVLEDVSFWTVFFWNRVLGVGAVAVLLVPPFAKAETYETLRHPFQKRAFHIAGADLLAAASVLTVTFAYTMGPVSIISPIASSSSLWLIGVVLIAHRAGFSIDTDTGRHEIAKKACAAVLAILGIALIS